MKPQLIVIDNLTDFKALAEYIKDADLIAFDTETTGLTKRDEVIGFSICLEETKAYYVIISKWHNNALEYLDTKQYAAEFMELLATKQLIMHNGVFDCYMVESYFKVSLINNLHTDTMILAHLLNENRRVGLKDLAASLFGEDSMVEQVEMKASVIKNGGILSKDLYEMYKADAYLMGRYGAKDALLTYKLFLHLLPDLYEQGLDKFFYEDESMPLLKTSTYELNTTGLQVDTKALTSLKNTLIAECAEAKAFIYDEIYTHIKDKYPGTNKKNGFNISSNQQLSWLLFGRLNLEFNTLTKAGKTACRALNLKLPYTIAHKRNFIHACSEAVGSISQPEGKVNGKTVKAKKFKEPWAYITVDKAALKKLAPKYKWIEVLLEYQRKQKILNTYVEGIESKVQYGIIQPSFLQHGTTSGRYSSRSPNFQNLPRDDQRVKECIVARPGKVFVSADYSQLEPRVFAYYSQDKRLMDAFDGKSDFYSVVGIEVYDKLDATPQKDGSPNAFGVKYKKLRDLSKVIALASAYGATPYQLAPTTGKSVEDTAEDMAKYFERFPGVKSMMLDAHTRAKTDGYVTNIFGRKRRIPEAKRINQLYGGISHAELPYDARKLLNLATNHRIQSTGASIINRAAIKFYTLCKEAAIPCKIVLQVHDELVAECNEKDAENVSDIMRYVMETTTELVGIALEAVPRISKNLAK